MQINPRVITITPMSKAAEDHIREAARFCRVMLVVSTIAALAVFAVTVHRVNEFRAYEAAEARI
ncbi:hypothetical protein OLZ32_27915 [Rhizobium sp. 1AS11]|uniref:hypothetical protein n=1 Tax=Rhizobium acaciae TaxID=2989736 RepID=UPI00222218DA|nr:hypothetical protein [Rhizobium acaciae]MCW1412180.1 hypothetical protein [Rhizobium acaciae]MCW1744195.1 hypothetical protein [Rhizobium acaciae]